MKQRTLTTILILCTIIVSVANETIYAQPITWEQTALDSGIVQPMVSDSNSSIYAWVRDDGLYRTTNNGNSWSLTGLTSAIAPDINVFSFVINTNNNIFAGTNGYGVYLSSDTAHTWTPINNGLIHKVIWSLAINPNGHIFAGTESGLGGGLFRTTDNGSNWMPTNFTNPTTSIAINSNGHLFITDAAAAMYKSTDDGATWDSVDTGIPNATYTKVIINNSGYVFATTFFDIVRSVDNGNTWAQLQSFNTTVNASIATISINTIDHIFVGTTGDGVAYSTDSGNSWETINSGLNNTNVQSLTISTNGVIFAGTYGDGIFRSTESTPIGNDRDNSVITFSLNQNYPNPFNPVTTIEFSLPTAAEVSLVIYNVTGQVVERLIERRSMAPGQYSVEWAPRALPSGVYFYRIEAGEFRETKRMLLVK